MKNRSFVLVILGALGALALLLPPSPEQHAAIASGSAVTLMSNQSTAGPGRASVSSAVTPAEGGADRLVFAYHANGDAGRVQIETTLDGSTWIWAHTFSTSGDEIWATPSCGVCVFRATKLDSTTAASTVIVAMSGAGAAYAPSYTPTATPTVTRTPTVTPTHG